MIETLKNINDGKSVDIALSRKRRAELGVDEHVSKSHLVDLTDDNNDSENHGDASNGNNMENNSNVINSDNANTINESGRVEYISITKEVPLIELDDDDENSESAVKFKVTNIITEEKRLLVGL